MTQSARTIDFIVTAKNGRPLASFETYDAALGFRRDRAARAVPTRIFQVETRRKELP